MSQVAFKGYRGKTEFAISYFFRPIQPSGGGTKGQKIRIKQKRREVKRKNLAYVLIKTKKKKNTEHQFLFRRRGGERLEREKKGEEIHGYSSTG